MANTYFGPWQIASVDASKASPRYAGDCCAAIDTAKFYVSADGSTWVEKSAVGPQGPEGPEGPEGPAGGELPVGFVFISVVSTSPATLLGYGTWVELTGGCALVTRDAGDADFDTPEEVVGAKTKAISAHAGAAVADHASHTHQYTDVPNHVHVQTLPSTQAGNFASGTRDTSSGGTGGSPGTVADALSTANPTGGVATGTTQGPSATLSHSVTQPSAHSDLNVVQKSIVVYAWKRTA